MTPSKNLWHCLGACRAGGSVIDWVMRMEGVSFRHAVELLRADLPSGAASSAPVKIGTVRKLPAPVKLDAGDAALLSQVVDYYHEQLKQSPEALSYLKLRGIDAPEAISRFKLGFANRTLGLRLPARNRESGALLRGRLQRLGIIRESGHEHLNGCVVFPIIAASDAVMGLYGRRLREDVRGVTPSHLYLPGPHRGVWNEAGLAGQQAVIVLRGHHRRADFLVRRLPRCHRRVRRRRASPSTTLAALKASGARRIIIAYDRDDAGDAAAEELGQKLIAEGFECFRALFPRGMDANSYALKVQPARQSLGVALRQASWMGKGPRPVLALTDVQPKEVTAEDPRQHPVAPLSLAAEPLPPTAVKVLERLGPEAMAAAALGVAVSSEALSAPQPAAAAPRAAEAAKPPLKTTPPAVPELPIEQKGEDEFAVALGERRYRVRGLSKNTTLEVLKVNLLTSKGDDAFHVDTLDLYSAKARAAYVAQASKETGLSEDVLKRDLGRLLLKLEELQEAAVKKLLEPKEKTVAISDQDRDAAMALLKSPDLLARIVKDFEACGVVGEETNKLVGYLAATSRKLDEPLAVIIQSSSAAGKTSLMEAVLQLLPEEDRVKYSAMTGQSLFYMGDQNLKHKVLAIVEEEGASRAAYALKLLQSEGELTIASTGKDPQTGRLVTQEYRVEGPVMIFLTTTAIELDDELLNRCIVLTVDEDRAQTRAIHELQRKKQTLAGLLQREDRNELLKVHRNAQPALAAAAGR